MQVLVVTAAGVLHDELTLVVTLLSLLPVVHGAQLLVLELDDTDELVVDFVLDCHAAQASLVVFEVVLERELEREVVCQESQPLVPGADVEMVVVDGSVEELVVDVVVEVFGISISSSISSSSLSSKDG